MGNVSTNVYAKFRCAPLRIKKASGLVQKCYKAFTIIVSAIREMITNDYNRITLHGTPQHIILFQYAAMPPA